MHRQCRRYAYTRPRRIDVQEPILSLLHRMMSLAVFLSKIQRNKTSAQLLQMFNTCSKTQGVRTTKVAFPPFATAQPINREVHRESSDYSPNAPFRTTRIRKRDSGGDQSPASLVFLPPLSSSSSSSIDRSTNKPTLTSQRQPFKSREEKKVNVVSFHACMHLQ